MSLSGARRIAMEWWLVALVSSAVVVGFAYARIGQRFDDLVYDQMLELARHAPDERILLVAIDSRSLQEFGRWPWHRDLHAALIERLAAGRPRALVYDVLFLEPDDFDPPLAAAMQQVPTYLPLLLDTPGPRNTRFEPVLPVEPLRAAAKGVGHVNLYADPDGLVRGAKLVERDGARTWPHLVALVSQDLARPLPPTGAAGSKTLISFAGPDGTYPTISAAAVLRGELPPEFVRDRILLVGGTAQGLGDRHPVPIAGAEAVMSGVEIQANLLDGLLHDRLITESGGALRALVGLVPLWMLLFALRSLRPTSLLLLIAFLVAAVLVGCAAALTTFKVWIAPTPALTGLFLVYPLWGWRRLSGVSAYMVAELERLRSEPDGLASLASDPMPADPVMRETMLLAETIERLRATRRFIQNSLDRLPDAFLVLDRQGHIILSNRSAQSLLAASARPDPQTHFRHFLDDLPSRPENDAPSWPPPKGGVRFEALTPDRCERDILLAPYGDDLDSPAGWVVRMSDVSALRTAQRQREEMLRFLTHDMRSPQTSILALTAQARPGGMDPQLAERIDHYAHRTLELADGIVHLTRAEMLAYEPAPLNLPDLLQDGIDDLWPQIRARKVEVVLSGIDQDLTVMGEPGLLTRAIINIIDNALNHSPPGGRLHCSVSAEPSEEGGRAVCTIRDEGKGIDTQTLAILFEQFQRGAATPASRSGAGLGLAFVQTVVARHGGTITCESAVGKGTSFTLRLPLAG